MKNFEPQNFRVFQAYMYLCCASKILAAVLESNVIKKAPLFVQPSQDKYAKSV